MLRRFAIFVRVGLFGGLVAGCASGPNSMATPMASASLPAGPPSFRNAGPPACAEPISEYEAVIDNDQRTGHLNPAVYRRIVADLEVVKTTCGASQIADARARLAGVKHRYGYR